jgi:hypothetical protein
MLTPYRGRLVAEKYLLSPVSSLLDRALSSPAAGSARVVLTGFWRSGTTLLLQSLASVIQARTVFEPLDPRAIAGQREGPYRAVTSRPKPFSHTFMPFSEHPSECPTELLNYLSKALASDLRGYWIRSARRGVGEYFRKSVVVKTVRGQLCLKALSSAFGTPLIHITRDPRGVAASIRRGGWWGGWLDSISLEDLLLRPEDGRRRYFSRWSNEISRFDGGSSLEKAVAYWALTEEYVRHCRTEMKVPVRLVRYESLPKEFPGTISSLAVSPAIPSLEQPLLRTSPTTSARRCGLSLEERAFSWKSELSRDEIRRIEDIARVFGLEETLHE